MIAVRLIDGITSHFPARRSEWALASMLFATGVILLLPGVTFDVRTPIFRVLADMAEEDVWGYACLLFGGVRLMALIINGTFLPHSKFSRYSPHARGGMAFGSCFFWAAISYGLFATGRPAFGLGCYPFLLLLDISNVAQAFLDAGNIDQQEREKGDGV